MPSGILLCARLWNTAYFVNWFSGILPLLSLNHDDVSAALTFQSSTAFLSKLSILTARHCFFLIEELQLTLNILFTVRHIRESRRQHQAKSKFIISNPLMCLLHVLKNLFLKTYSTTMWGLLNGWTFKHSEVFF